MSWETLRALHSVRALGNLAARHGVALSFFDGEGAETAGSFPGDAEPHQPTVDPDSRPLQLVDEPAIVTTRRAQRLALAPIRGNAGPEGFVGLGPYDHLDARSEGWLCELARSIAEEIERYEREQERSPAPRVRRYPELIGEGPAMAGLFWVLDRVVDSESTVLLQGENGTGKELCARAIHHHSRRRDRPFVAQNCSAFNDNLLDSELFGHRRGSFTGAVVDKRGLFEAADGGTFFLDEISETSAALQVKLLRVLQEGTFIPVGDTAQRKVDVRVIAATNRDLPQMVAKGAFREDLYYRINVLDVHVPPLRERPEDLDALIDHFLDQRAERRGGRRQRLTQSCRAMLRRYPWPGNVRELENEIERLVVLAADAPLIGVELLSPRMRRAPQTTPALGTEAGTLPKVLDNIERTMIAEVLARHGGNKTHAAAELGISRRNLIRKVQKYRL